MVRGEKRERWEEGHNHLEQIKRLGRRASKQLTQLAESIQPQPSTRASLVTAATATATATAATARLAEEQQQRQQGLHHKGGRGRRQRDPSLRRRPRGRLTVLQRVESDEHADTRQLDAALASQPAAATAASAPPQQVLM